MNPFDDPDGRFLVLADTVGNFSLWPVAFEVPTGWAVVFGEDTRAACLARVDQH